MEHAVETRSTHTTDRLQPPRPTPTRTATTRRLYVQVLMLVWVAIGSIMHMPATRDGATIPCSFVIIAHMPVNVGACLGVRVGRAFEASPRLPHRSSLPACASLLVRAARA